MSRCVFRLFSFSEDRKIVAELWVQCLKTAFLTSILLILSSIASAGQTIFVDIDAAGTGTGSSWYNAFNYLQDALAVASESDEIRVAEGVYKPDQGDGITPGDRSETFQLISDVAVVGGYAGWDKPAPNARDVRRYETILSGDLNGNDIPIQKSQPS